MYKKIKKFKMSKYKKVRLKMERLQVIANIVMLFFATLPVLISCNRPPRFALNDQTEIVLRLKESPETKVGTLIYVLRGYDPDNDTLTFGKRSSADSEIIRIENSGTNEANVYLAQELDRETKDEHSIVLTLTDNQYNEFNYVTQSLLILVEDINDNTPIFLPYQSVMEIPEDSRPGFLMALEATDADEGAYGQVMYYLQELEGDNDIFSITTNHGKGIIRLMRELDYETKNLYQLRILAIDRANQGPVNTGTAAILVKITDVADQPPEFVKVQAVARIPENVPVGTHVLRVVAIDGDHGINNPIAYEMNSNELFDIERETGIVYTINELDREEPSIHINGAYVLNIIAYELTKNITTNLIADNSIQTEVTVIITDINDEIPTFGEQIYRCEVNENSQRNTPLNFIGSDVQNVVYDHDVGKNGTFRLFLDPYNDLFEIVPSLAVNEANFMLRVKNSNSLDYEVLKEVNFTIFAREIEEPSRWSAAHIQIYIKDQNDNAPQFLKTLYNVSIAENSETGTEIVKVGAIDKDSNDFGTMGIRYLNLRGGIADLLHLDPITGLLTIKQAGGEPFDREMISRHYLSLEAIDNLGLGNRNTAQIIINIEDINDNAPIFLHRQYEARLLENSMQFELPLILEARDNDLLGTENSQVTYEIVDGLYKNNFSIDPASGMLFPLQPFDYEELLEHKRVARSLKENVQCLDILVRARDSGTPMLSTIVPVLIYVEDVNDNPPIFEQNFYAKTIPEDFASGQSILQIRADDRDGSSPNNEIVFRIQNGAADKFVINSETGVISVATGANLDPDLTDNKRSLYTLKVLALDGGIGKWQLSNTATVNISIKDVNNKFPIIKDMPTLHVMENRPVGTVIYQIEAYDLDENPILRFKINWENSEAKNEEKSLVKLVEYDYESAIDLNPVNGTLKLLKTLDREKIEYLKLCIIVEDLAAYNKRQIVESFLNIQIDDENDNNPKFQQPFYSKSIPENSMNGVLICSVLAYDIDKNRNITYSLKTNVIVKNLIHLDSHTGEILVANKIDHEQIQFLNFTVRATDSGSPPKSSYVDVHIKVLDENDNSPFFVGGSMNYTVSENAEIGTRIGIVEAMDADSGDFGKITFLMDRISAQGKFTVDADTGVLSVAEKLDRETKDGYTLVIEAWDNYQFGFLEGQSRNAFKQIHITVLDENDNTPEVHLPKNCVLITEYHDISEKILVIQGKDADDPNTPNGRLQFEMKRASEEDLFDLRQINYWTAEIYAKSNLRNRFGNYTLIITTKDQGVPANIVTKSVDICVSDFNDHAPVFVIPLHNTTIRIPENTTVGSLILQFSAVDEDVGMNALVRYRLKPDPLGSFKLFHLNADTGELTLNEQLNREKQKIHELRVEAYDQGLPTSLSSVLDLTIYVSNVNDYEPQFIVEEIMVNFTEHADPGSEQFKLPDTVDKDEVNDLDDPPGQICYFIISGNDLQHFKLDPQSHIMTVQKELDREVISNFTLLIKATEKCENEQDLVTHYRQVRKETNSTDNTIIKVHVRVVDINDNAPKFRSKLFTGGLTTNADFGTKFMRIEAFDKDDGINAKVSYYQVGEIRQTLSEGLENVRKDPFLIDVDSGEVQLNFDPQKGMKGYFDFMVIANDTSGMRDVAHVVIYLLRSDQKVRFVFRLQTHELRDKIEEFRETLSNISGSIVNIDEMKVHENNDGSVDKTKTDLYIHLVNKEDNSIYEVSEVLHLIDANIERLNGLFKELNVLDTQPAMTEMLIAEPQSVSLMVWLIFTNLFLATLLIVTISLCAAQSKTYKRKLRAAKINIFQRSSLTLGPDAVCRVPNTNKHCVQGSNPIWLKGLENDWYKPGSQSSDDSENASLDNNLIEVGRDNNVNESLKGMSEILNQPNDLNKHFNVYNHIDKLTNNAHILAKRLETTEL